ncbi:MAG: glycoside hydrolase family 36 protein [Dehalococcoidia bacterium]
MANSVASGRGRNGPWLQNQWLRIETRQDDASIAPVALAGDFRPTERAMMSAQPADAPPIVAERAEYDVQPYADELGEGKRLTLIARVARRGVTLRREVVLYDAYPFAVTRVGLKNESAAPLPLDGLYVFTTGEGRGRLRLSSKPDDWRIYRHGWQSWSPTMSLGGGEVDVRSRPPVLSPEEPPDKPGQFASDDVGALYDPASGRSLLAGAVTAREALTQVYVDAPSRALDVRCLFDGATVLPQQTVWSERVAIDLVGRPNDQLARYAEALGLLMGARVPATTPAGWCSWYYFYQDVTEDDVMRNLRFIEQHRRELPIDTVQIDDGYQADIGDWLIVNEKFPRGMDWLASEIKRAGYTPGIWLAPFLIAESSRAFAEHPEFVVRDEHGEPALATENWQRRNYGIDGSLPEARAWLRDLFRSVCDGWGYDYVKIDFLFAAALRGGRHDADATRVRAYREALAAVREGTGDGRFILGCGSLMAPSVGFFDGNRVGLDVGPWWRYLTTAERAGPKPRFRKPDDQLSAETAIRNSLNRTWMHGRLWANDPDCLLVRTDRTKLTIDETQTLASVIGLSAGMMLSSDDLDKLPPERLDLISMLLPVLPHAARALDLIERDMPERYEAVFERDFDHARINGVFNFGDDAQDLRLDLPDGRWHAFELWGERYLGIAEGSVEFLLVPPHGCRVVALRPAGDQPQLIATTGHIGMGVLDITGQAWDEEGRRLVLDIAPVGRRSRVVYVSGGGLAVLSAMLDGAPIRFEPRPDHVRIEAAIDAAARLVVTFG